MEITVKLSHLKITPRKVRQIANLIRDKKAVEAEAILEFLPNKPGKSVLKLLKSAIASAKNNFQLDPSNLYISEVFGDEGPKLKRSRPVSRGSAHPVWKRTSHITLTLNELKPTAKKKLKKAVQEVPAETIKEEPAKEIDSSKKQDKPRFEMKETKSQRNQGKLNRIFRRKSF